MERIWVVHVQAWSMQLMWPVDAKEACGLGDYRIAPVGGYDPPPAPVRQAQPRPEQAA